MDDAGAGHDDARARPAGQKADGAGGVGRGLLVAHADIGEANLLGGLGDRPDGKPDDAEHVLHALVFQAFRQQVGAFDLSHVFSCQIGRMHDARLAKLFAVQITRESPAGQRGLSTARFAFQTISPVILPVIVGVQWMKSTANNAVAEHRKRLKQRGLVRIELRAPKEDARLLRDIAGALSDPARATHTRRLLREHFNPYAGMSFKELLAAAPLDLELDFDRTVDAGREIEF